MATDWYKEMSAPPVAQPQTGDWYAELSGATAPAQVGGAQQYQAPPADLNLRPLNQSPPTTLMGKIAAKMSGRGRAQYDLPEFDLPPEFSARQAKTALGLMTTADPEREQAVWAANYPDLKFYRDEMGNIIADGRAYGGGVGYVGKPGATLSDLREGIFQALGFVPAGALANKAATVGGQVAVAAAGSGLTQAGMDIANQATGGTESVSVGNIKPMEVGAAAIGGGLGQWAGAMIGKYLPRWTQTKTVTPQMREEFKRAAQEAGTDPAAVTDDLIASWLRASDDAAKGATQAAQQSDEFGIIYSRGEALGDMDMLRREDAMLRGRGSPAAQQIMTDFRDEVKNPSIQAARRKLQAEVAGKRQLIDQPTDAGGYLREGVVKRADVLDDATREAYSAVGRAETTPEGTRALIENMRNSIKAADPIVDGKLAPGTSYAVTKLDEFAASMKTGEDEFSVASIKALDRLNKHLNQAWQLAENKADRFQIGVLKREFARHLDDIETRGLMSGDEGAMEALKEARKLRVEYGAKFQARPKMNRSGKAVPDKAGEFMEKLISADPTDEQVINYIFGLRRVGGKNEGAAIAKKIKTVLGEDSQEWSALRQAAFLRLTEPTRGSTVTSGQQTLGMLQKELLESPTLMRELFSPEEIGKLRRFADAVKRAQPGPVNPSGTGAAIAQLAQQAFENTAASVGLAVGGVPGAVAAKTATKVSTGWRSTREAVKATRGATKPLRSFLAPPGAAIGAASVPEDTQ